MHGAAEERHQLHLGRQRSDEIDARDLAKLRQLLEAKLELTFCHELAHQYAGRRLRCLGLELSFQSKTLEELREVHTAWAARIDDRLRRAQRRFQRFYRRYIRLLRARAH